MSTRPARIAIDGHTLGSRAGGNESYVLGLLEGLQACGFDGEVILYLPPGGQAPAAAGLNLLERRLRARRPLWRLMVELPSALRRDRPDFAHFQYIGPPGRPCPLTIAIHDTSFLHAPELLPRATAMRLRHTTGWSMRRARAVLVPSAWTAKSLRAAYPDASDKIHVVPLAASSAFAVNGAAPLAATPAVAVDEASPLAATPAVAVDEASPLDATSAFVVDGATPLDARRKRRDRDIVSLAPQGHSPRLPERFCLYAGRRLRRKNVAFLLRAYAAASKLEDTLPPLLLIGPPSAEDAGLRRLNEELGIVDRVALRGYAPPEILAAAYRRAEFFCYPCRYEGFGLPLVEAMASGCAVLAADEGGLPETLGDAGRLLPSNSVPAWAEAIAELARDEAARRELGAHGRLQAQRFSWARTAETLLSAARSAGIPGI